MSKSLLLAFLLMAPAHADTESETQRAERAAEEQVELRSEELADVRRERDREQMVGREGDLADAMQQLGEAQAE